LLCPSDVEILQHTIVVIKKLPYWTDTTPAGIAYSRKLNRPSIIICVWDIITEIIFCDIFGPALEALTQRKSDTRYRLFQKKNIGLTRPK
jgi:hypothetical protein